MFVEAFIAEAAVEAFNKGVLHRLAGRDIVPTDAAFLAPAQHGVRTQFSAVVADDQQRLLVLGDDGIELARHPTSGDRGRQPALALVGEIVDDRQHPKEATIGQPIGDKVLIGCVLLPKVGFP